MPIYAIEMKKTIVGHVEADDEEAALRLAAQADDTGGWQWHRAEPAMEIIGVEEE